MMIQIDGNKNTIERYVHCPYCKSDEAVLITQSAEKSSVLQMPAFGKQFWLSTIFTFGLYPLVHGFPSIELRRKYTYQTYGFCPHCGKTYNAGVPAAIQNSNQHFPKVYRSLYNKKLFGICGGIAEYTGLNVKLVRIGMVVYGITFIPAIIYFLLGIFDIVPFNPKQLQETNNGMNNQSQN